MTAPANENSKPFQASSIRTPRSPILPRKVWLLGSQSKRMDAAAKALRAAGHELRSAVTGAELAPTLRDFRPDLIIIDMQEHSDRGRHVAVQLRADRATRQLPIILVGMRDAGPNTSDKSITGPTRRYALPLDAPSVLNAIITEL
ncbi:MAG: hypothetical protein O2894_08835 [Planctomycetota bacterium]|nr:hypothetical protein [Planctomycetota bacterium]